MSVVYHHPTRWLRPVLPVPEELLAMTGMGFLTHPSVAEQVEVRDDLDYRGIFVLT